MARLALLLVVLAGQIALFADAPQGSARAEDVVLVIDRGAGAKDGAVANHRTAQQLAERLHERGDTFRAYAVGARANGKPRVVEVKAHLSELDGQEGLAYEGPTDARTALAAALRGPAPKAPLTVVLIGAFGRVDPAPEGASTAVDAWNRTAPEGSRVIPFGLSEPAQKAVEKAKGWRPEGRVVLRLERVSVETEPWSAFAAAVPLRASVRATVEVAGLLDMGDDSPVVLALVATGTEGDTFRSDGGGGLVLERSREAGFETSVTLGIGGDGLSWDLSGPHAPIAVRWIPLPEVRWLTAEGKPPHLEALDLERGVPRSERFPYRRTGPLDERLQVGSEWPASDDFPAKLRLDVETEKEVSPFVQEGAVVLVAEYLGPAPLDQRALTNSVNPIGPWLTKFLAGIPRLFTLKSAPGRVRVRLTTPSEPQALPTASSDTPWELRATAENRNAPRTVYLVWQGQPPGSESVLSLRVRPGDAEEAVWSGAEEHGFELDVAYRIRPQLERKLPPGSGTVMLGVWHRERAEVTCEGVGVWRVREPRLVVESGEVQYRADAKDVTEERPLRLRLDADGGDGTWLAELLEHAPTVMSLSGAPQAFAATALAPGRWEVRRAGAWSGQRAGIFSDRTERLPLAVTWSPSPEPLKVQVPVTVPARWGRMGWVLLGLAALAAVLGLFVVFSHRALPLDGTLLYVVEGRAGAVGRLPLAPAGRRTTTVTADERGRLALGGAGTPLLRLLPTRVGGMAEVPAAGGGLERRLLVDGLSFSVGRHALRYVQTGGRESLPPVNDASSSATSAAPDLLGPEYDLPHGA